MNNLGLRRLTAILRGTRDVGEAESLNHRGRGQRPRNNTEKSSVALKGQSGGSSGGRRIGNDSSSGSEDVVGNAFGYDGNAPLVRGSCLGCEETALTSASAGLRRDRPALSPRAVWTAATMRMVPRWLVTANDRFGSGSLLICRRLLTSSPTKSAAGFTMMEIAISLAVIGIALVAIIGVLPIGMNVQQSNRQETIIGQDANVLMEAIRNGSLGSDDLTNYVYAISNFWTVFPPYGGAVGKSGVNGYTYGSASVDSQYVIKEGVLNVSQEPITNGANIIGLLSTPEYIGANNDDGGDVPGQPIPSLYFGGISNHIVAYCYSISGPAIQKPPQDNPILQQDSFGYHLYCVNAATPIDTNMFADEWSSKAPYAAGTTVLYNWMYWTCTTAPLPGTAPGSFPVWQMVPNYTLEMALNLHELRLTFEWPKLGNGGVGSGRETFRTMVAGQLEHQQPMNPTISAADTIWYNSNLWCYLPDTFTNTP